MITVNAIICLMLSELLDSQRLEVINYCRKLCSVIVIIQLMLSVCLCPKVITLSGCHCSLFLSLEFELRNDTIMLKDNLDKQGK